MAVEWVAAGIGAASLISGLVGGKKGGGSSKGSDTLEKIAAQSYAETSPLRTATINKSLAALMGQYDVGNDPLVAAKKAAINSTAGTNRNRLEGELSRQGLHDSSAGVAALEDFDRNTASLLTGADTSELEHLIRLGESIGFGGQATAVDASKATAGLDANALLASQARASDNSRSAGQLMALLLSRYLASSSSSSRASSVGGGSSSLLWGDTSTAT